MRPTRVRRALVYATLGLTALPLFFLFCAWSYERWLTGAYRRSLEDVVVSLAASADTRIAAHADCEAQIVDASGAVVWDSHTEALAIHPSLIGGLTERIVEQLFPSDPLPETWSTIAPLVRTFEADPALRREAAPRTTSLVTPSGQSLVFISSAPRPDGGAAVAIKVSRRGLRRLIALHHDLAKLMLFQLVLSLVFAIAIGRWLVTPLERLTEAARAYPTRPLGALPVATRSDEIGELARSFTALAEVLEARRRTTAEVGADIAHEFKNPLATIAASAELLTSARPPDEARRALIAAQIAEAVERLRKGLDRMLGLLRLEVELQTEAVQAVDYRELVDDVLAEYRADPRGTGWTFVAEVEEGARDVALVAARWRELLRNLIDNALDQPASRREIAVKAHREGTAHVTLVRDHGNGVSPGNRDKIFRRFFTQRPATAAPGTGLGLSIVTAIAAAHGGVVSLDDADGEGAQFRVSIPHRATT